MELVKYIHYLDSDERQVERFIFGLNPRIRALVSMWKPSSVAEAVECGRYAEEHLGIKKYMGPAGPLQSGFPGKAPRNFFRGDSSRPPYGNRFTPRNIGTRAPTAVNTIAARSSNTSPWASRGTASGGRNLRGINTSGRSSFSRNSRPDSRGSPQLNCWGCGGPHFQRHCPEASLNILHRTGKEPISNNRGNHRIHAVVDHDQVAHQSTVVESSGCQAYVIQEVSQGKGPSLGQYPVLAEFPDVFPKELPGLPPVRELDLTIELKPGTQPISKTPYRMTAPELQELQIQLKELLDIGHIRPSTSPWGAPIIFVKKKD
eukprot:PITA_26094